jgi:hypothetical protein
MQKSPAAEFVAKPLSENAAAEAMWLYYRDNKTQLVSEVRDNRDYILAQIASGVPAAKAFARFTRAPEPAKS